MKMIKDPKSIISKLNFFFNLKYKKIIKIPEKTNASNFQFNNRQKSFLGLSNNKKFENNNIFTINKKNIFGLFRQTKKVEENSERNKESESINKKQNNQGIKNYFKYSNCLNSNMYFRRTEKRRK